MVYLFFRKCHQDNGYKQVQNHKRHEDDARTNDKCTKNRIVM